MGDALVNRDGTAAIMAEEARDDGENVLPRRVLNPVHHNHHHHSMPGGSWSVSQQYQQQQRYQHVPPSTSPASQMPWVHMPIPPIGFLDSGRLPSLRSGFDGGLPPNHEAAFAPSPWNRESDSSAETLTGQVAFDFPATEPRHSTILDEQLSVSQPLSSFLLSSQGVSTWFTAAAAAADLAPNLTSPWSHNPSSRGSEPLAHNPPPPPPRQFARVRPSPSTADAHLRSRSDPYRASTSTRHGRRFNRRPVALRVSPSGVRLTRRDLQVFHGSLKMRKVASKDAIRTLVYLDPNGLEEDERFCNICYVPFNETSPDGVKESPVRIPACNHVFGDKCLRKWLSESPCCPYCRHQLPAAVKYAGPLKRSIADALMAQGVLTPDDDPEDHMEIMARFLHNAESHDSDEDYDGYDDGYGDNYDVGSDDDEEEDGTRTGDRRHRSDNGDGDDRRTRPRLNPPANIHSHTTTVLTSSGQQQYPAMRHPPILTPPRSHRTPRTDTSHQSSPWNFETPSQSRAHDIPTPPSSAGTLSRQQHATHRPTFLHAVMSDTTIDGTSPTRPRNTEARMQSQPQSQPQQLRVIEVDLGSHRAARGFARRSNPDTIASHIRELPAPAESPPSTDIGPSTPGPPRDDTANRRITRSRAARGEH